MERDPLADASGSEHAPSAWNRSRQRVGNADQEAMMRALVRVMCGVAVLLLAAQGAWAGKGAALAGRVVDQKGDAIVGAMVRVASRAGVERLATTAKDGTYALDGVAAGSYLVEVSALGFRAETREDVRLDEGASAS